MEGAAYVLRLQEFLTSDKFRRVSVYKAENIDFNFADSECVAGGGGAPNEATS